MQSTENKMTDKFKVFLRPALAIVLGFIGVLIARSAIPAEVFSFSARYFFILVAFVAFGILGFILPDILEFAGRASITALARQIAGYLPSGSPGRLVAGLSLRKRKGAARLVAGKYTNPLLVDTSALIDGRLADIVETGFLSGTLLVLPAVVRELHQLSDSADEIRRQRGRRGLDVLSTIQRSKKIRVVVLNTEPKEAGVDDKLVRLAKQADAKVITVDFNLNKVSHVIGVSVLNVNELANAVKTAVLPNERLNIMISTVGREKDQGVGYLKDGTMVIVEGGAILKGRRIAVNVVRVLQTVAGKMIFGKIANESE